MTVKEIPVFPGFRVFRPANLDGASVKACEQFPDSQHLRTTLVHEGDCVESRSCDVVLLQRSEEGSDNSMFSSL